MKQVYQLKNLDCANCASKMETAIAAIEGVERVSVSFMTQRLTIHLSDDTLLDEVLKKVLAVCRKIEPGCEILC